MERLTRRDFLRRGSAASGALFAAVAMPVDPLPPPPEAHALDDSQRRLLEALVDWMLPEVGAVAGVATYIDTALAGPDADRRALYLRGLAAIDVVSIDRFGAAFADVELRDQAALLRRLRSETPPAWPEADLDSSGFLDEVRRDALRGLLSDPAHGGNREHLGWRISDYPGTPPRGQGYTPEQMRGAERIRAPWGYVSAVSP